MLNESSVIDPATLNVLDYGDARLAAAMEHGQVNTPDEQLLENIRSSIRRGHPQIRPCPPKHERVCLVGSGPSLQETLPELRDLYFQGAHIVTVNGSYAWCLERNIRPSTQIILDARPSNARFLYQDVPRCRYVLASQCAPEVWDAVEGREHVWIFHASAGSTGPIRDLLDAYYLKRWLGIGGGVTVATRALMLLSETGYLRFDLFGIDSCWVGEVHHAFDQPENRHDRRFTLTLSVSDDPAVPPQTFRCSPWHLKQFEDFLQLIRVNHEHFLLQVHGPGLLASALRMLGPSGTVTSLVSTLEEE